MNEKQKTIVSRIEKSIKCVEDNDFTIYFFVVDSKGVPNGSLDYIYRMAKTLQDSGRRVMMVYQLTKEYTENEIYRMEKKKQPIDPERKFIGVGDWMGAEFAALPHMNTEREEMKLAPSDMFFIPEAFSSVMFETYKHRVACKRVVVLHNFDYVTDTIPIQVEWKNYGIADVVAASEGQAKLLEGVFPYMDVKVVPPCVPGCFRKPIKPQGLIVNLVCKKQSDINRIIKPFYWKYPIYKFVTFRELRNLSQEQFAEYLQEGAITVWVDADTPFGYSALEAMRCGNVVIGRIPETVPDWMKDEENGVKQNGLWTYDINTIPDMLSGVISTWMQDKLPQELYDSVEKTNELYTQEEWDKNVVNCVHELIDEQLSMFKDIKGAVEKEGNKARE
ncbi:MAG: hypothetical protein LUD72_04495 [Bacteroidales bacterium]|nr:hypothetical protein [Bacteroidales bacterium]